ncbi:tyrosine-type recombinase/integrase [Sedimentitalea sp. JM2-8]|uniref:Tyrosine-type recombinase/integrase n=1 Tax=Sedimentitalea xiamensis TaxID=3050037 RepID=A0ABT7FKW4_9RHOB|nr:tyrosine-type recombinase/integrase [Sedimentitalea xiamensis]MDK3075797.1 tyrosine-type recombinase/integrase [Sedimentitalea xiamensis]
MPTFKMRDGTGSFRLKFVVEDTDRHGNVRVYLRKPGHAKVRLKSQPGTQEFLTEYRSALHGAMPQTPAAAIERSGNKGTFKWLCEQYYGSAEYKRLSSRTQYVRRRILDGVCEKDGSKPFALLEPRHVRKMRDEKSETPEAANSIVKALRQIFGFAVEYELTTRNPARDVPYIRSASEGFHSWSMEEVAQFENHHELGSKARLALALLLYTGQRRSDVVLLGPQHIKDGWLTLTQQKNRSRKPVTLSIPVLPELEAVIDATPTGNLAFLVTAFGKPFTSNGFGNWFRKQCDAAGLNHCSAHGLRKAGAALAAENGATERQLMAIFGWSTMKEASRYTRAARQKVLAASGMKHLSRSE